MTCYADCLPKKYHVTDKFFFLGKNKQKYFKMSSAEFAQSILSVSCLAQIYPASANSVDPDQLASSEYSIWIYSNNPYQTIWLAEN